MKPIGILLLIFCVHLNLNTSVYGQNLVVQGKTWVYLTGGEDPNDFPNNDFCFSISGDTLIANIQYEKLIRDGCNSANPSVAGFIRETEDSLVYYRPTLQNSEYLLYNFGIKNQGDSVFIWNERYFYLDSLGEANSGKKTYYLTDSYGNNEQWIDGVGSKTGLLMEVVTGGTQVLNCCLLNGEELYHNTNYQDCYFATGIKQLNLRSQLVSVYVDDKGQIEVRPFGTQASGEFQLFTTSGIALCSEKLSVSHSLEICPTVSGLLIYRFTNTKGEMQRGKLFVP